MMFGIFNKLRGTGTRKPTSSGRSGNLFVRVGVLLVLAGATAFLVGNSDGFVRHSLVDDRSKLEKYVKMIPLNPDTLTYQEVMSDTQKSKKIVLTEEEWRKRLESDEYRILREKGTELPFINEYNNFYEEGVYVCRACGNALFHSETKYNSRSGWPSFWKPVNEDAVDEKPDNSYFMRRTETVCSRCGSHIGHVFDDGPQPTGLRYCMNSKALQFIPKKSDPNDGNGSDEKQQ